MTLAMVDNSESPKTEIARPSEVGGKFYDWVNAIDERMPTTFFGRYPRLPIEVSRHKPVGSLPER